jgi:hypothetical protein
VLYPRGDGNGKDVPSLNGLVLSDNKVWTEAILLDSKDVAEEVDKGVGEV